MVHNYLTMTSLLIKKPTDGVILFSGCRYCTWRDEMRNTQAGVTVYSQCVHLGAVSVLYADFTTYFLNVLQTAEMKNILTLTESFNLSMRCSCLRRRESQGPGQNLSTIKKKVALISKTKLRTQDWHWFKSLNALSNRIWQEHEITSSGEEKQAEQRFFKCYLCEDKLWRVIKSSAIPSVQGKSELGQAWRDRWMEITCDLRSTCKRKHLVRHGKFISFNVLRVTVCRERSRRLFAHSRSCLFDLCKNQQAGVLVEVEYQSTSWCLWWLLEFLRCWFAHFFFLPLNRTPGLYSTSVSTFLC